jgi:Domain of unknown function (DUF4349)
LQSALGGGGAAATSTVAASATELPEQLVVEGALQVRVGQLAGLVPALRAEVERMGGRIVEEQLSGADAAWSAQLRLRLPPAQLEALVSWFSRRGDILEKRISASDVSKQLFDHDLALKNAQVTLERLEAILRQGGLSMQDVLAIERELTRLRGEIESIKGQAEFLRDRVALATLDVWIAAKGEPVHLAEAKAYPGVRAAALILLDPDGRERSRLGVGLVVHSVFRAATLEVELFRADDHTPDASTAVIATFGGAVYSDFFGRGERRFGNPYLGARLGYGYLDAHRFAVQGEVGVELFKSKRVALDVNARLAGLIGADSELAAIVGGSAAVAF